MTVSLLSVRVSVWIPDKIPTFIYISAFWPFTFWGLWLFVSQVIVPSFLGVVHWIDPFILGAVNLCSRIVSSSPMTVSFMAVHRKAILVNSKNMSSAVDAGKWSWSQKECVTPVIVHVATSLWHLSNYLNSAMKGCPVISVSHEVIHSHSHSLSSLQLVAP